jgi:drug/metabolite transporter (DMT)-like permease
MFIGEISALVSAFSVAAGATLSKFLTGRLPFLPIQAFRSLIGGITMVLVCLVFGKVSLFTQIPLNILAFTLLASILGIAIGDALYMKILSLAPVSKAFPVITSTRILLSTMSGAIFFHESVTWTVAVVVVLMIGGIYLAISSREGSSAPASTRSTRTWVPIALLTGFLWSTYYVFMRMALRQIDVMIAGSILALAASIILFLVMLLSGQRESFRLRKYGTTNLVVMGANGIIAYVITTLLELWAINLAGVARTSILVSWSPILIMILAAIFLKEKITMRLTVGVLLCVGGTILLLVA